MIEPGQIIKNLIQAEPVKVTGIRNFGGNYSISFAGVNSNRNGNKVLSKTEMESLEVISTDGSFRFDGDPKKFLLYAEAERIHTAYQFDPLFAVNCSIVDPLPHQVEAVYKFLLPLPKIRFLLADDTGAGKTIMAGLLLKELLIRGYIERILIITPGGLTKQWQEDELRIKFNLPFRLVNRAVFNAEPTIFANSNHLVTSIDFLRGDDVINVVKETNWDMVIVDEAHKLSAFDYGRKKYKSKRYETVQEISKRCEHLLLLTATPHRGRKDTFRNLLQLLDPDIFASDTLVTKRVKEYEENGINKFFIRRLKEDMQDWDGNPLFKERHTHTVKYSLTPEEKDLYDDVTRYLMEKREVANEKKNIHVTLTLLVMQRRLTSSIYAIMRTLENRYRSLKGLTDELRQNPSLFKSQARLKDIPASDLEEFEELGDDERESWEKIISDPKKWRLFTTAEDEQEIKKETEDVRRLMEKAQALYGHTEKKYERLGELLRSKANVDEEKLVLFTEHKDTLDDLAKRLTANGHKVVTIHGGKSVDERRQAQFDFARDAQILIATDAAGEGINLQFCKLLINWDIPWNPNRLEQRMGRIHRYGQKSDVNVFNMVAENTREGKVLERLLGKLDLIREQLGDDRVYDVINEIFEGISMEDILKATFEGKSNDYTARIDNLTEEDAKRIVEESNKQLAHSQVNYADAKALKDHSDERRLQPIYVRLFFERAFESLGGQFSLVRKDIYKITKIPEAIIRQLKHLSIDKETNNLFCFDKATFHDYQNNPELGKVHYINPGNIIFDALVKVIRTQYREEMLKGTILVSPEDRSAHFAFFVKSQIADERQYQDQDSVADERLYLVQSGESGFSKTSPAKFIDLKAPLEFSKPVKAPAPEKNEDVIGWAFNEITLPQLEETREKVVQDVESRKEYLQHAFTSLIADVTEEVEKIQQKVIMGREDLVKKMEEKQGRIQVLLNRKEGRLKEMEDMLRLSPREPEVLGCAYVVPLSAVEYQAHFGMSRDPEAEQIAMDMAMKYEEDRGWHPSDVSANNEGYDIRSVGPGYQKRYIEVKGRMGEGGVMISENEYNRLSQLGDNAWLYIVVNCGSKPQLFRVHNPGKFLNPVVKSQYLVPLEEWKRNIEK